jgi:3-hydroxybutyryl-CoA dehydrogenase
MAIKKIAIVGAGIMGNGIAQVAATAGYEVTLRSRGQATLDKAQASIKNSLARMVKSGRIEEAKADEIAKGIKTTQSLEEAISGADFVIESIAENLELKQDLFAEMDKICPPHTILASNTSQLSVTAVGSKTGRQDKVVGCHWFNPPPVMKLVEIVRAGKTSDETLQATVQLCQAFGKETIVCKDTPGFVVNRLLLVQRAEALRMLDEGVASAEDIDRAIELGLNHPVGPFKLADMTGLDTALSNLTYISQSLGAWFQPTNVIKKLVEKGTLGRKTGRGFYDYSSGQPTPIKD